MPAGFVHRPAEKRKHSPSKEPDQKKTKTGIELIDTQTGVIIYSTKYT